MMYSLLDLDPSATLFNKIVTATNGSASSCSSTPPAHDAADHSADDASHHPADHAPGHLRKPGVLVRLGRLHRRRPGLLERREVAGQVVDHQ